MIIINKIYVQLCSSTRGRYSQPRLHTNAEVKIFFKSFETMIEKTKENTAQVMYYATHTIQPNKIKYLTPSP